MSGEQVGKIDARSLSIAFDNEARLDADRNAISGDYVTMFVLLDLVDISNLKSTLALWELL